MHMSLRLCLTYLVPPAVCCSEAGRINYGFLPLYLLIRLSGTRQPFYARETMA